MIGLYVFLAVALACSLDYEWRARRRRRALLRLEAEQACDLRRWRAEIHAVSTGIADGTWSGYGDYLAFVIREHRRCVLASEGHVAAVRD